MIGGPGSSPAPEHRAGGFRTDDGLNLRWQAWIAPDPRADVLLSHGLGEHGGRYARLAADLASHGISLWTPDHRGHGLSEGARGYVPRFDQLAADFERFRLAVSPDLDPSLPRFLYGHSLGGLIALRYLQTHPPAPFRGAILSAPLLAAHDRAPRWKTALAGVLNRLFPALPLSNEIDPSELSHDAEYVRTYREDPLVHPWISPRMYAEMLEAMEGARSNGGSLALPLLFLLPGADPIVRTDVTEAFARSLAGDVTVRVYEGMYHEPHNEVERARLVADVAAWIAAHAAETLPS
ncbi:MAG: lysophospholipase [Gemmatimonadetes bacterium]|nr:lysophospholipase [Gemmatimonadota bacterium]